VALLPECTDTVFVGVVCISRFYSHDSSFVHGGIEKPGEELPPVMGQAVSLHSIFTVHAGFSCLQLVSFSVIGYLMCIVCY